MGAILLVDSLEMRGLCFLCAEILTACTQNGAITLYRGLIIPVLSEFILECGQMCEVSMKGAPVPH